MKRLTFPVFWFAVGWAACAAGTGILWGWGGALLGWGIAALVMSMFAWTASV